MGQVLKTGRPLHDLLSRVFAAQELSAHTSFGENAGCASGRKPAFLQAQVEILEDNFRENVHISAAQMSLNWPLPPGPHVKSPVSASSEESKARSNQACDGTGHLSWSSCLPLWAAI